MTEGQKGYVQPWTHFTLVIVLLSVVAGCAGNDGQFGVAHAPATLNIGFGLTTGQTPGAGMREIARSIAVEGLLTSATDGRLQPRLAEKWSVSKDGLNWIIQLRPSMTFHDGTSVTASVVRDLLLKNLPVYVGPAFEDVEGIRVSGEYEIAISLKQRSYFVLEGLDLLVQPTGELPIGTGPFYVREMGDRIEMSANENYHAGKPIIDRIVFTPYASVRSAWADMLRGQVDMLYDVGVDALDSLESSRHARVFTFERPYAYLVTFNMRKAVFAKSSLRQALNAAIDRTELVSNVLNGHGIPSDGPVWPRHWAFDSRFPRFKYEPRVVSSGTSQMSFKCLYFDPTHERIALLVQRQLQEAGVAMDIERVPYDQIFDKLQAGDFDAFLSDVGTAPTMIRPFLFWYSRSPLNWGRFSSRAVDAAFDTIRHAASDDEYSGGIAAFQRAIIDDPPAIFLAWSERARAVSTRFEVPAEPGLDILSTLRLWRPVADNPN